MVQEPLRQTVVALKAFEDSSLEVKSVDPTDSTLLWKWVVDGWELATRSDLDLVYSEECFVAL